MMGPEFSTTRIDFPAFKSFMESLGMEADDEIARNIYDTICAQTWWTDLVMEKEKGESGDSNVRSSSSSETSRSNKVGVSWKDEAEDEKEEEEGFCEQDWAEYITNTFLKRRSQFGTT